jgi:1-phosphofructokinase
VSTRPEPAGAVVFAPAPLLTVTVEPRGEEADVHLHAGGQGFWLARMITALGVPATLCGSFGGEIGTVVRTLIEAEGVRVRSIDTEASNPAYVHDRRSGSRVPIVETTPRRLSRHEVDELYGMMLVEGLEGSVSVLGGTTAAGDVVPAVTYRRLAADLTANGRTVVADLSGAALDGAVDGGITLLKVSDEELLADGRAASSDVDEIVGAAERLRAAGARNVVVSRRSLPAVAILGGQVFEVEGPKLEPLEERGAGDSMTAGIAAGIARGRGLDDAVRLGAAAGALNVTRHGLGTGQRDEIERLAEHVHIRPLLAGPDRQPRVTSPADLAARARPA